MNVEIGASAGTGAGIGGSIGIGAEGGRLASLEAGFGRVMGFADIRPIVNEGVVSLSDLEATMPIQTFDQTAKATQTSVVPEVFYSGLADTNLDPSSEPLETRSYFKTSFVILRAKPEGSLANASISETSSEILRSPRLRLVEAGFAQNDSFEMGSSYKLALVRPYTSASIAPLLDSKSNVDYQAASLTEPELEQQVDQVEFEVEQQLEPKEGEASLNEEEEVQSRVYLEDEQVSDQRRHEIRVAIIKAKLEVVRLGLKKITGELVAKFLPADHPGNRSQIVKEIGPDGSLQETVDAIASVGDLRSEEEAVKRLNVIVAEKKPVKLGKEGLPVTIADVSRVLKYRIFKSVTAFEVVVKRVVKKKNPTGQNFQLKSSETTLADFPQLAEVFERS